MKRIAFWLLVAITTAAWAFACYATVHRTLFPPEPFYPDPVVVEESR